MAVLTTSGFIIEPWMLLKSQLYTIIPVVKVVHPQMMVQVAALAKAVAAKAVAVVAVPHNLPTFAKEILLLYIVDELN